MSSGIKKLANFSRVNDIATDVNEFLTFSSGKSSSDSQNHNSVNNDCRILLRITSFQFLPIELASDSATISNPFCGNWRVRIELIHNENNDVFDSFYFDLNGSLVQSHSSIENVFTNNNSVKPCKIALSSVNGSNYEVCSNLFDMIFEEKITLSSTTQLSPRKELYYALSYTFPFPHFLIDNLFFKISIYTVEKPSTKKQQQQQQELGNSLNNVENLVAYCKTDVISTMYQPLNTTFLNKKIRVRAVKKKNNITSTNALSSFNTTINGNNNTTLSSMNGISNVAVNGIVANEKEQKPRCNIQVKVEKFV
ncbi:predicted protein [Naegleria gruberi]|uniref:Predicted protein n=1 Tax=Naegleria gruberi TaxID=5762 RepID=D2V6S3_NAEGR|nr:uncharacterized protein NAEGRDRAFT_64540 [Naegleria gruberi]EFC47493.1 predicted protein [Naegleria gruberi]|eukprot:XP_002680237.1 predicted protein [Naegleria gruberi strain NEG-M]